MCLTENSADEWAESISQTLARAGAVERGRGPSATNPVRVISCFLLLLCDGSGPLDGTMWTKGKAFSDAARGLKFSAAEV